MNKLNQKINPTFIEYMSDFLETPQQAESFFNIMDNQEYLESFIYYMNMYKSKEGKTKEVLKRITLNTIEHRMHQLDGMVDMNLIMHERADEHELENIIVKSYDELTGWKAK
jgi:hypothetical protein